MGAGWLKMNRWIQSLLPLPSHHYTYCEPFAGMCSILLNRSPAKSEIVNDSSKRLWHLLTTVRGHHEEFARLLEFIPYSEAEYERALREID